MLVQEELDCVIIDDIGNFKDSFRLVLIHVKCGNLIKINDGGQLTVTINQKMKSGILL